MNPLETLVAARNLLAEQIEAATEGPWSRFGHGLAGVDSDGDGAYVTQGFMSDQDAALVVSLRAAAPAILAMLDLAIDASTDDGGSPDPVMLVRLLALAIAILEANGEGETDE
ncbi:hypothetical protein LWF01_02855 [Saxibacter everestensis]|uniref:Uncharacterized protein n=1 Tax=Saxibacter everestensis TaxID=2909229 RepID=A0ABY8QUR3_9MICO|nr:hypothetical protein LWF01_02855 [Brevibacteriaceae bacterium ZFBP1038]